VHERLLLRNSEIQCSENRVLFQAISVDAALHKVDFDDLGELAQSVAGTSGLPDVVVEAGQLTARFQALSANVEVRKV
jgi:hypothetical protein